MRILFISLLTLTLSLASASARHPQWDWSTEMPHQILVKGPAINRDLEIVDKFFKDAEKDKKLSMQKLLDYFGRPDGFSPQFIHSDKRSSRQTTEKGGTFRFLLADGGEFHVWTANFSTVSIASVYPRGWKTHAHLLYNQALLDTRSETAPTPTLEIDQATRDRNNLPVSGQ